MESGHITKAINKSYVKKGITWASSIKKTNKSKLINCCGTLLIKRNSPMKPTLISQIFYAHLRNLRTRFYCDKVKIKD